MSIQLDDRVLRLSPFSPVCSKCKHWTGTMYAPRHCNAFGATEIPSDIWDGRNNHTSAFTGDNGILFEMVTESDLTKEG